ncbi:MAG: NGG1p interacting factor NIF3 [Spirochaetes bacterium]|nr:NGG1p interacting factor NIF3 [Spirochaetota bacterium]
MHLLYFYVDAEHAEIVKEALFKSGAGRFNNYEKCSFQTAGKGQFTPLPGADPFIGDVNHAEIVDEMKVEMICRDEDIHTLRNILLQVHPYEEPAYGFIKIFS